MYPTNDPPLLNVRQAKFLIAESFRQLILVAVKRKDADMLTDKEDFTLVYYTSHVHCHKCFTSTEIMLTIGFPLRIADYSSDCEFRV